MENRIKDEEKWIVDTIIEEMDFPTIKWVKWQIKEKYSNDVKCSEEDLNEYIYARVQQALEHKMMNAIHSNQAAVIRRHLHQYFDDYKDQPDKDDLENDKKIVVVNFGPLENTGKNKI